MFHKKKFTDLSLYPNKLTFLALLQRPDGLSALVLRQQVFASEVVRVSCVKSSLQQEITSPVPKNLKIDIMNIKMGNFGRLP